MRATVTSLMACALVISGLPCGLIHSPADAAIQASSGSDAAQASSGSPSLEPKRFDAVKTFLRRGAYEEAQQALQALLRNNPDDPQAQLYFSLCEQRLRITRAFNRLSAEEWQTLQQRLDEESRQQKRSAAVQKAMDRQIGHEQDRWDRQLEQAHKETEHVTLRQQRATHAEAAARRKAEKRALKKEAQQETVQRLEAEEETVAGVSQQPAVEVTASVPSEEPAPAISAAAGPVSRVEDGSVELSPVVVATTPSGALASPPTSPSLVGKTLPLPGAIQINARQMSVSPDQRIAIADGDVEVVFENALLTCDHLTLFTDTKDAYAEGRVRVEEGTQVFRGEMAHYNFETKKGRFLQGTVSSPPWHEHGRAVEHIAEGVYEVTPGYLTTCELEPPHFRLAGRKATVFAEDKLARMQNVALFVEDMPFLYLPYLSFADRKSPFFIIPGKKKPWEQFALMGYRYKLPFPGSQEGTVKVDWRRAFGWGVGLDHQFDDPKLGKGLLKLYFNEEPNIRQRKESLPKGARKNRYRLLWRHRWMPMPDTTVVTDIQEFSDVNFRKELLFREEFTNDDLAESFVSVVTNDPNFTFTGQVRKRMNRFQSVTESLPQLTVDVRQQRIGDTQLFSESRLDFANYQSKIAHSDADSDVIRVDWFQQLRYAMSLFRPIEVTPKAGIRQTYYTKDRQGSDREGDRNIIGGQWNTGVETSLKLFRIFPVKTNFLGMSLNALRHVLTPTVAYDYVYRPTVANDLLSFSAANGASNRINFGIENKLQTRRPGANGKLRSVDLGRLLVSIPYTFRGVSNKQGGRLGDWSVDFEAYPTHWMRVETDWTYQAIKPVGVDSRSPSHHVDLVMVGGEGTPDAKSAPDIQAPPIRAFELGPQVLTSLLPKGQWFLGLSHRYSRNDKTEDVLEYNWQVSEKWQIGTYHRFTWKEVTNGTKRFNNLREYQYRLRRDLHDWIAELVYRVDREFGEELYLTLTLKAYPQMPIELQESYHQPKIGSQSSLFSPIRVN